MDLGFTNIFIFYLRSWLILFIVISQPSFEHRLTLAIYSTTSVTLVEWIVPLLRLSDAGSWRNSQKNASVWSRSDYTYFFRNLFRVERVTESEILAPSARAFNEHEILGSAEAAQEERSSYRPIPILKCELFEQSTSLSQDGNDDQIVFGCELIDTCYF